MLFVMRQTLNLSNQHLLTHISVNKMMIVIQCTVLPDRRIPKEKRNVSGAGKAPCRRRLWSNTRGASRDVAEATLTLKDSGNRTG